MPDPTPIPLRPREPARRANGRPNDNLITEDFAAQRFAILYRDSLRFCHSSGCWFFWNGVRWLKDETRYAFDLARTLARELARDEDGAGRYIITRTAFAGGIEKFAKADRVFAKKASYWDRDPYLLGTPAGPVDLRTGQLIAAKPDDGITKSTAVSPGVSTDCPLWFSFLREATGDDEDLIRFLRQFVGYALTGDVTAHALMFIYGGGGNGKSVFLNTVTGILGDYAITAAMETFTASQNDRHSTELAMLHGARLVTASETEEGKAWAEAKIKSITGGDPITARFMRQDNFTYQPQFKLFVIGNHKPVLRNVDDAARRRFNIVPFTRKPAKPDRKLEQKLEQEWPAILRWMIEGCLDWQSNGLLRSASVVEATDAYFGAQDTIGQFLDEECDFEPGNEHKSVSAGELFSAWTTYARAAGEDAGSQKAFADAIERRGVAKHRTKNARMYRGVRLLEKHRGVTGDA